MPPLQSFSSSAPKETETIIFISAVGVVTDPRIGKSNHGTTLGVDTGIPEDVERVGDLPKPEAKRFKGSKQVVTIAGLYTLNTFNLAVVALVAGWEEDVVNLDPVVLNDPHDLVAIRELAVTLTKEHS